jgi:hypothetical protein
MVVTYEDQVYTGGNCDVISEHLMICPTPSFEDLYRVSPSIEKPLKLDYGFDFDDTLTGNLTLERGFSKLFVYPDPKLLPISEKPIVRGGSDLVIKGTNLVINFHYYPLV